MLIKFSTDKPTIQKIVNTNNDAIYVLCIHRLFIYYNFNALKRDERTISALECIQTTSIWTTIIKFNSQKFIQKLAHKLLTTVSKLYSKKRKKEYFSRPNENQWQITFVKLKLNTAYRKEFSRKRRRRSSLNCQLTFCIHRQRLLLLLLLFFSNMLGLRREKETQSHLTLMFALCRSFHQRCASQSMCMRMHTNE